MLLGYFGKAIETLMLGVGLKLLWDWFSESLDSSSELLLLSELAELVPFPYYCGGSILYSDRLLEFSITILRCYEDIYIIFFPSPSTYTLELYACRMFSFHLWSKWLEVIWVNRHLWSLGFFQWAYTFTIFLCFLLFLLTPYLEVIV